MTEDSAIQIDCVTLQSLCTLPTLWSSSSIQHPGTCPTGSLELAPWECTRTSPTRPILPSVPLTASPTFRLGWPCGSVSTLPPEPLGHLVAKIVPTGTELITTLDVKVITTYR